ncbi:unnamed protein product [Withania somnifera]
MGNCIVLREKVVRVIKTDGKILEYKGPIKVHQVLSQFPNHVISNSLQVNHQNLLLDDDMLGGKIYYLLPKLPPPKPSKKKKVKFADDQLVEDQKTKPKTDVLRIKLKEQTSINNIKCSVIEDCSPVLDNIPKFD